MEEILNIVRTYGADAVVLAIIINVLTGFLKIPIKRAAPKMERRGFDIKKYITFIPIALGVILASLANGLIFECGVFWNERVTVLALSASSLSLSIYAVLEKFFGPSCATEKEEKEEPEIAETDFVSKFLSREGAPDRVEKADDENVWTEKIILGCGKKEKDDESKT